jgi:hypothetical protein
MRWALTLAPAVAGLMVWGAAASADEKKEEKKAGGSDEGFVSLFDGKTLEGWSGDPELWKVVDGAVVGKHGGWKRPNTFLCTKEKYGDFVLKISFRLVEGKGNSGVQFRSERIAKFKEGGNEHAWMVKGYQADIDGGGFIGCQYEERGRGILAHPNPDTHSKLNFEKLGLTPKFTPTKESFAELQKAVKKDGWNEYVITADGDHITQELNGVKTVEFVDAKGAKDGIIALQMHAGGPMEVQFKDIKIKKLDKK